MALSKIPDQTHSYKGQAYTFVGQSEALLKELECPHCHSIVSEPVQPSCGHLFCRKCFKKHSYKGWWNDYCPVCRVGNNTVQDNYNGKRVKALQVKCTNHTYGCKWVGNLNDELQHRIKENECHFEEILCPHGCGQKIRRMTQSCHSKDCQMRPHKCEYCGEEGPYCITVQDHLQTCRSYPERCPNGCNKQIAREDTASYKLKKTVSSMEIKLQAEEQRVRDLEDDTQAKTERICQLEREIKAKDRHICDLERDAEANTEHIHDLERDVEAKTERIYGLERDTTTKEQHVAQLTTENSEKQNKIKHIKMFIVLALGIIVIFRLHPLYFIPIFILYSAAYV